MLINKKTIILLVPILLWGCSSKKVVTCTLGSKDSFETSDVYTIKNKKVTQKQTINYLNYKFYSISKENAKEIEKANTSKNVKYNFFNEGYEEITTTDKKDLSTDNEIVNTGSLKVIKELYEVQGYKCK